MVEIAQLSGHRGAPSWGYPLTVSRSCLALIALAVCFLVACGGDGGTALDRYPWCFDGEFPSSETTTRIDKCLVWTQYDEGNGTIEETRLEYEAWFTSLSGEERVGLCRGYAAQGVQDMAGQPA